ITYSHPYWFGRIGLRHRCSWQRNGKAKPCGYDGLKQMHHDVSSLPSPTSCTAIHCEANGIQYGVLVTDFTARGCVAKRVERGAIERRQPLAQHIPCFSREQSAHPLASAGSASAVFAAVHRDYRVCELRHPCTA